jgi:voltage-gated sodium channel
MVSWARRIAHDRRFQTFIMIVILGNAVLVGLETFPSLVAEYQALLEAINAAILAIFLFEIAVRLISYWPRPLAFFRDGWNVFDFVIVALSMLPAAGSFATVARLARLLRVLRLISAFPELRLIVATMLRSLGSMGSVLLLMGLVMYVYAIVGYHLFGEVDPANWGSLGASLRTLFEILTLEGWVDLQETSLQATPYAWIFYGSFILIAVFVVVNLFIAVVLNNLEEVRSQQRAEEAALESELLVRLGQVRVDIEQLEHQLRGSNRGGNGRRAAEAPVLQEG